MKLYLDYREKDGYEAISVLFHPHSETVDPFELLIYIGGESNPFYAGPANLEDIARQIFTSVGPSGANTEYLFKLAEAMKTIVPEEKQKHDQHLYELERLVKKMCDEEQPNNYKSVVCADESWQLLCVK